MFSNKENLYILIQLKGQDLTLLRKNKSGFLKDRLSFPNDQIVLFFAPKPEVEDHYMIFVDFNGNIEDCIVPAKAGHGFPYSSKIDINWDSKAKCGINSDKENILIELEIPVKSFSLQSNLFKSFGFNIQRHAVYLEGKTTKAEDTCWSHVNGELWNTQNFGLVQGPLYQGLQIFTEYDLNNLDQMTNGMTALLKSLDIYYKAVINYEYHIPEGTEINGDISNFDHVPLPQYTVKADGYYRFYNALKYQEYKDLGNHIINKLYKAYKETKDKNGKNFLLWNNLISEDGKVYTYDTGQKMSLFARGLVPYDQSKNKFYLKGVVFQDALGQGFLDLSEIKDTLDSEIQAKLTEIIYGTLVFLHQPYILVKRDSEYFWRIDEFTPYSPKPFEGKLNGNDWPYLGQDIVLMFIALHNIDAEKANQFFESMIEFSKFYVDGRLKVNNELGAHQPHNIYKLDHRMLSLAKYAKEKKMNQFEFLDQWLAQNLPKVYEEIPKVDYSDNGATNNSWSTQGVLEIYRLLEMKSQYTSFWNASFEKSITPLGISQGHRILPMNFSSYPLYFDYANKAFRSTILNKSEYCNTVKKMFLIYGNPVILRDNIKFSRDLTEEQRSRPMWGNAPYDCYVEGVLPEGIYANGSAQAFYTDFGNSGLNEFFDSREEHKRYEYCTHYYQYTAPFQYHSDRYSYGKAESMCLANIVNQYLKKENLISEGNKFYIETTITTPNIPSGLPVFVSLDTSDLIFQNESVTKSTQLKITKVVMENKSLPFRCYQLLEFNRILSEKDKAKLVIGLWNQKSEEMKTIRIYLENKVVRDYFPNGSNLK